MIQGLIFDFDGLIVDTETPEYEALNELYREHGQFLPVETFGKFVGSQYNDQFEPVAHLRALTGNTLDVESAWARINQQRMKIIHASPPLPGVESYLREAKARGLKLALASSSPHSWVDGHLRRLGLFHFFDVIKAKEDVRNVKPDPELFLAALDALQLSAGQALILKIRPMVCWPPAGQAYAWWRCPIPSPPG